MANTFKNKGTSSIGTSDTTVYTASGVTATVLGMTVANRTGSNITATVRVYDNSVGSSYFIVSGATVPTGGSLVVVGGDQKIVLEASDYLIVNASASSSVDAFVSVLEQT